MAVGILHRVADEGGNAPAVVLPVVPCGHGERGNAADYVVQRRSVDIERGSAEEDEKLVQPHYRERDGSRDRAAGNLQVLRINVGHHFNVLVFAHRFTFLVACFRFWSAQRSALGNAGLKRGRVRAR